MFKQTALFALVMLMVGTLACQAQEQAQEAQVLDGTQVAAEDTQGRRAEGIRNNLVDLAIIGARGAKRVATESKPTLEQLGKTIDEEAKSLGRRIQGNQRLAGAWSTFRNSKYLERAVNGLKPVAKNANEQYEKLSNRAKPLIDRAAARAKPILDQAEAKRRQLLAEHEARQAELRAQQKAEAEAAVVAAITESPPLARAADTPPAAA